MYPTRPVVRAHQGMVVSPHRLASIAGQQILRQGGNAVDAAIATNAALGVVYPHMTGLGGDAFWLIYDAKSQQIYGLNGSGRSAQAATVDFYHNRGYTTIPQRGILSAITVPGAVASWGDAHTRFGHLPWAEVLQPAIALAEQGYPVTASQSRWTQRDRSFLSQDATATQLFMPQGQVPKAGTILHNPLQTRTLQNLATEGSDSFYQGNIASRITQALHQQGSLLSAADFATHTSTWIDPIHTTYRGHTIWELPPNTQGFTVLQILNLIEAFDLQRIGHDTPDYYHLLIEATKLAFADRDRWLTDPDFLPIPLTELISKTYAARRRDRISFTQTQAYLPGTIGGDTTYSAFVDRDGNAVSLIQSLYFDFGSGVMAGDTGVLLQNRGSFFALDQTQVNCLAPRKRTFHTLIPGLVTHADGSLHLVFGTMGGEGQPQTQIALLTRLLDFGFDPQTAIDWPRWVWGRTWGETISTLTLEGRLSAAVQAELRRRGHDLRVVPDWSDQLGHAHIIRIDATTGELQAGCDPRSDGEALGI